MCIQREQQRVCMSDRMLYRFTHTRAIKIHREKRAAHVSLPTLERAVLRRDDSRRVLLHICGCAEEQRRRATRVQQAAARSSSSRGADSAEQLGVHHDGSLACFASFLGEFNCAIALAGFLSQFMSTIDAIIEWQSANFDFFHTRLRSRFGQAQSGARRVPRTHNKRLAALWAQ